MVPFVSRVGHHQEASAWPLSQGERASSARVSRGLAEFDAHPVRVGVLQHHTKDLFLEVQLVDVESDLLKP